MMNYKKQNAIPEACILLAHKTFEINPFHHKLLEEKS